MLIILLISALGNLSIAWLVWKRGEKSYVNRWFVLFGIMMTMFVVTNIAWGVTNSGTLLRATWFTGMMMGVAGSYWVTALIGKFVGRVKLSVGVACILLSAVLTFIYFDQGVDQSDIVPNASFVVYSLLLLSIVIYVLTTLLLGYKVGTNKRQIKSVLIGATLFLSIVIPNSIIAPYFLNNTILKMADAASSVFLLTFLAYTTVLHKHGRVQTMIYSKVVFYLVYGLTMAIYGLLLINVYTQIQSLSGLYRSMLFAVFFGVGAIAIHALLSQMFSSSFGFSELSKEEELRDLGSKIPSMQLLAHEMHDRFSAIRHVDSCVIVMRHPETDRMIAIYPEGRSVILNTEDPLFARFRKQSGWIIDRVASPEEKRVMEGLRSNVIVVLSHHDSINCIILLATKSDVDDSILESILTPHIQRYSTMLAGTYAYFDAIGKVIV